VSLVWNRDRVHITVADDGGGARTAPAGGVGDPTAAERSPGYGLIGMRERATAIGGDLSAAGRPDGGFLVSARLPFPPARDTVPRDATRESDVAVAQGRTEHRDAGAGDTP
jgi:nitrate/nitrite-specific signal transduction histidine kinase